jgi:hypothetical protein
MASSSLLSDRVSAVTCGVSKTGKLIRGDLRAVFTEACHLDAVTVLEHTQAKIVKLRVAVPVAEISRQCDAKASIWCCCHFCFCAF